MVGMLTEGDREFLGGETVENESTNATKRHRIRERAKAAIQDFSLLNSGLSRAEREKIQATDSLDALAFLLQPNVRDVLGAPTSSKNASAATAGFYAEFLGRVLSDAIERALDIEDPPGSYRVAVAVEIEDLDAAAPSVDELEARLQAGEIDPAELREFYDDGQLSLRELVELTRDGRLLEAESLTDAAHQALLDETPPMLENDDGDE